MTPDTRLVTVTSYGASAGSSRVRVFDWLRRLQTSADTRTYLGTSDNSIATLARHPARVAVAEARLRSLPHDIGDATVLLSRQASPLSTGRLEAAVLGRARRGVYDVDDALHLLHRGPFAKARIWRRAVAAADIVIAGNDTLAEAASMLSDHVVVIPSCVEPSDYRAKQQHDLSAPPRAVWIGSPATEKYLAPLAPAIARLHASHGLRLTVVSAGDADLGALAPFVDRVAWRSETFADELVRADVGVMPLPDDPWTRGKCAYKLLQYAATGLPLVGSPVGVNRDVLAASEGLAPGTWDEWGDALAQVLDESAVLRARRGAAARRTVETNYSFDAWTGTWATAVGVT